MPDEKLKGATPTTEEDEWSDDQAAFLPSWDYSKAGPFVGRIESMRIVPGVVGLGGVVRDVPIFTLESDDGTRYSQWGTGMLARVLPDLVGQRVKIVDKGLDDQGDGTSLRVFDVRTSKTRK